MASCIALLGVAVKESDEKVVHGATYDLHSDARLTGRRRES
jgi:hypothetical protein